MDKPIITSLGQITPITFQQYERYLPSAFDESLTHLEKLNKVIQRLNDLGLATNDVVTQWNTVMEWVMSSGLEDAVNLKLDGWKTDGTLDTIINQNIFNDLTTSVTTHTTLLQSMCENVLNNHPIGDGITNDSEAFQTSLDKRGIVYIPQGNYLIDTPLIIHSNTVVILHPLATLIRGTNAYCIFTTGNSSNSYTGYNGAKDFKIMGGILDCKGDMTKTNGGGISFAHSMNVEIKGVVIKNPYNIHHIEINSSENVLVDKCRFEGYYHDGTRGYVEAVQVDMAKDQPSFPLYGQYDKTMCQNITIQNCYFVNVARGIGTHVTDVQVFHDTLLLHNNVFENLSDNAIHSLIWRKATITDNKIYNSLIGVYFENSYECMVSNNHIKTSQDDGIVVSNSNTINIESNVIRSSVANGITCYNGCKDINILGNTVSDNAGLGINIETPDTLIIGNSIKRNTSHGIYVHSSTAKNVKVNNNIVSENKRNGILFSDTVQDSEISMNHVNSNNQSNDGSSNIILVTNCDNNRIIGNVVRGGGLSYTAINGLYIGSDCDKNIRYGNDLTNGGTTVLNDLSTSSITSVLDKVS